MSSWASLHRVPAQSVGLKTDHERTLRRIIPHIIFTINVSPEQLCFQMTPW